MLALEINGTIPLPGKIYANEGIAQVVFFEADKICETPGGDKRGNTGPSGRSRCRGSEILSVLLGTGAAKIDMTPLTGFRIWNLFRTCVSVILW